PHLQRLGFRSCVAAPASHDEEYEFQEVRVRRYAVATTSDSVRELYGTGDPVAAAGFERVLASEQPDVVHLHALTRGVPLRLVRLAKEHQLPVVFTYHTPTVSCERGTTMRWGWDPCDGRMNLNTWARCTLDKLLIGATQRREHFGTISRRA